ncbi:site-specific integrase [soil metagenome]
MEHFVKEARTLMRLREGVLGPYLNIFAKQLLDEGYARTTACQLIRIVGVFSGWLRKNDIAIHSITTEHTRQFLEKHPAWSHPRSCAPAALKRLLSVLVGEGVAQSPPHPVQTPAELLADEFACYLKTERALSATTILRFRPFAVQFLIEQFADGPLNLSIISAEEVINFVRQQATRCGRKNSKNMVCALRSFFRFVRYQGFISLDLAASVPTVAHWSNTDIPKALPAAQVELVLKGCNRKTGVGCRDYAILLLLARLGLRACEVASLNLEDIDWEAGCITVRGKGGSRNKLPVPGDVGEAIALYLRNWRPQVVSRSVFLRHRAPVEGFRNPKSIGSIVKRALVRASIDSPRRGAHQFRHGLATEMLRKGASLSEIGELLRHQSVRTTGIYAKVDLISLRSISMPWPGGAQ